jgi:hypothetical protein
MEPRVNADLPPNTQYQIEIAKFNGCDNQSSIIPDHLRGHEGTINYQLSLINSKGYEILDSRYGFWNHR